jgi:hypothetical protein
MANLITHALTYSKEDAQKYFLQPLFVGNSALDYFEIMTGVKSSQQLDKFSTLSKITKAEASGFTGATGVTMTQRSVAVARMEAEVEQAGGAFWNSIKAELLRTGNNKDDISGTKLQSIVADIMLRGVKRDLERQLWFGNTNAVGVGASDYTPYNGIFAQLSGLPGGQKLAIASGALGANVAQAEFDAQLVAMPSEGLENRADLVFFATRSMCDNYRATLSATATDSSYSALVGGVPVLAYQGIPIVEMGLWDSVIAADGGAGTTLLAASCNNGVQDFDAHISVLTVKNNIVVATDYDSVSGADMWYNKDQKMNRFRFEYVIGTNFKNTELTVVSDSNS